MSENALMQVIHVLNRKFDEQVFQEAITPAGGKVPGGFLVKLLIELIKPKNGGVFHYSKSV